MVFCCLNNILIKYPMGEPESLPSSNPVFIVIMRNSRGKLFVYVAILGVLCFIVFLLSSTHSSLKELEGINEKCQQQRDSLSAQLQVVYEHKNRLEKSLQQEKTDHKQTKEGYDRQIHELEFKIQEEKDKNQKIEIQVSQLKTNNVELEEDKAQAENALKEQLKTVQSQKDAEIEKLQTHISELLAEKDKLEVANNGYIWKVEQHVSEINLCHLQQQQIQTELTNCQESLKNHQNLAPLLTPMVVGEEKALKAEKEVKVDPVPVHEEPLVEEVPKENKTVSVAAKPEKSSVLEKPHVLPAHPADEGVLPQPPDDNKELDAALEMADKEEARKAAPPGGEKGKTKDAPRKEEVRESENSPQVAPPNNFIDGDKDDHAAERGEYGPQYVAGDAKQQVEVPDMKRPKNNNNNVVNNDLADAQMQDMMNKSPGEVQPQGSIDAKIQDLKSGNAFLHRDAHRAMDDKNYEEDDDDRENDEEPLNGPAAAVKGLNVLQDNDFDDQENPENADNAKEVEGVVVAPK